MLIAPLTETVTVTRTEEDRAVVPQAISVIQGDDIQTFHRKVSLAEAFGGIPGVFAENRRNFSLSGGVQLAIRSPLPPHPPRRYRALPGAARPRSGFRDYPQLSSKMSLPIP